MNATVPTCPRYLVTMVSYVCNYRCPGCYHGFSDLGGFFESRKKFMSLGEFQAIADELAPYRPKVGLNSLGEVFANPEAYDIIAYASSRGLRTEFDTNGSLIDPHALAEACPGDVIFSVDGMDQETYVTYRKGGNLRRVLDKVVSFAEVVHRRKIPTSIYVKYLINRYTEDSVAEAQTFFESLPGVTFVLDYFIPPPPSYSYMYRDQNSVPIEIYEEWRPRKMVQFDMYRPDPERKVAVHRAVIGEFKVACKDVFNTLYIDTTGEAYPCCQAVKPMYPRLDHYPRALLLGNVLVDGVLGVFHGSRAMEFRRRFVARGGRLAHCGSCRTNYVYKPLEIVAREDLQGIKTLLEVGRATQAKAGGEAL